MALAAPQGSVELHEPRSGESSRQGIWGGLLTAALTGILALMPLVGDSYYYYVADTAEGAYGVWFHLGEALRGGSWPLLNPQAWMSGNYAAEGQWGLFSPTTLLISLLTPSMGHVVAWSTAIKVGFLQIAAVGTYALVRDHRARAWWAILAGLAAASGGFTLYMDAPSWVTSLMVWAFFPWAWLGLRRLRAGGNPVWFLVPAFLTVTVGYVHGTLALIGLGGAFVVLASLDRDWRLLRRVLVGGVFTALVVLGVYLPGVLTSPVTIRDSTGISNDGFMVPDLTGLASSVIPTALAQVSSWWGWFAAGPILYTSWIVPAIAFADRHAWRRSWMDLRESVLLGAGVTLFMLGPSYIGPFRFPVRMMPYLVLVLVVTTTTVLSRTATGPSPRRLAAAQAWAAAAAYISWSQSPAQWEAAGLGWGLTAAGLGCLWWLMRRRLDPEPEERGPDHRTAVPRLEWAPALAALLTVVVVLVQHLVFDGSQTSSPKRYPATVGGYQAALGQGINDAIVVGSPSSLEPAEGSASEVLVANMWYLNGNAAVQNLYTTISYRSLAERLCMNHRGDTCPELLATLFQPMEQLRVPLVDALSLDTVMILRNAVAEEQWSVPPEGWALAEVGDFAVTWVRERPLGRAGGVVDTGDGEVVRVVAQEPSQVLLDVPPSVGARTVVLSRLDWPGYSVQGARHVQPSEGFLLTIEVPPSEAATAVAVRFSPPGWGLSLGSMGVALLLGGAWITVAGLRRRKEAVPPAVTAAADLSAVAETG